MIDDYLLFAKEIAKKAGNSLMLHYGQNHKINEKGSIHSIVSDKDIEVEKIIISAIKTTFPSHSILSEEYGMIANNSEYLWVIDPLDGSSYYINELETFSVSIALFINESPTIGVVFCPVKGELFWAIKDKGAFLNEKAIQCSENRSLSNSIASFGHRFLRLEKYKIFSKPILTSVRSIRGGGSCAMELCYLAAGRIDLFITVNQSFWDYAAGALIAAEAGAIIKNLDSQNEWTFESYWNNKFDIKAYSASLSSSF